jgi:uncharacterized membrane protein
MFLRPSALFFTLATCALALVTVQSGCNKESPTGGPAATNDTAPSTGNADSTANNAARDGFRLEVPSTRTVIDPGTSKEVTITIDRDGNFKEPVALTFQSPAGVTVKPSKERFEPNDKEVVVALEAGADAKPGEASVQVTGKPQTGQTTSVSIPIEVRAAGAPASTATVPPPTTR